MPQMLYTVIMIVLITKNTSFPPTAAILKTQQTPLNPLRVIITSRWGI